MRKRTSAQYSVELDYDSPPVRAMWLKQFGYNTTTCTFRSWRLAIRFVDRIGLPCVIIRWPATHARRMRTGRPRSIKTWRVLPCAPKEVEE